ncbi:glycogen/starch synthase [Desulfobacter curvatus]|uniref:glycogen/starch synthase n=1 Tax=Desulfobacter curvatus TaxID=2290 RepID=UPI000366E091|nr:glycogen/starch synthase [Desulfobacter curvatus]
MPHNFKKPKILFVTPEVSYLPEKMSTMSTSLKAKAGELADASAALIDSLYKKGADIHVALPDYRTLFNHHESPLFQRQLSRIRNRDKETRIHLAKDWIFFKKEKIYSNFDQENIKSSLAFQREVINTIVPRVQPDLIHCNDWMTGLIPAIARKLGIPCLFTIHNIYNNKALLSFIEDRGIDAAYFWQNLFFERQPLNYEETRGSNPVDFLASGIFAAHFVNTTRPEFLKEMMQGRHPLVTPSIKQELSKKVAQGCASGILNYSDGSRLPKNDTALFKNQPDADSSMRAIDKAMMFYELPRDVKDPQLSRIMKQSHGRFDHSVTAEHYLLLYEKMLERHVCDSIKKRRCDKIAQGTKTCFNNRKQFDFITQEDGGPDIFLH